MSLEAADYLLDSMAYRAEEQIQLAERLRAQFMSIRIDLTSQEGEVSVTIDSSGNLLGLRLTSQAMLLDPDELARVILATTRSAQLRLTAAIGEIASRVYGGDSESAEFITKAYTDQFARNQDEEEDGARR